VAIASIRIGERVTPPLVVAVAAGVLTLLIGPPVLGWVIVLT
jgi:hypothetical protein